MRGRYVQLAFATVCFLWLCATTGCSFDLDELRDRASDGSKCTGRKCASDGGDSGTDGGDPGGAGGNGREGGIDGGDNDSGGNNDSGGGNNDSGGSGGKGGRGGTDEPDIPDLGKCLENHGDCDVNANCIEADDPADDPTCDCRSGFAGDGTACEPAFTDLLLSAGTITPALDEDVTTYNIVVPITTERLVFTASAASQVTIVFNDDAIIESGADWQSPLLDLGFNSFTATLQLAGHADRAYKFNVTRGKQEAYLKGDMLASGALLGLDVAIDGDTVVVGAPGDMYNSPSPAGSVYVFVRDRLTWTQQARLIADASAADDWFGTSVAVSGDSLVIGTPSEDSRAGAVYVFTRSGSTWTKQARLKASNATDSDAFGTDVALSGDTLVASALYEGSNQTGVRATAPTDTDAAASGAAYVFTRASGTWTQRVYLKGSTVKANDGFGNSIAIAANDSGGTYSIVVAASSYSGAHFGDGSFYAYRGSGASWTEEAAITSPGPLVGGYGYFATSVDVDGDWIVVGAPSEGTQGRAYAYEWSSGAWQARDPFTSDPGTEYDYFGTSVAISGRTIVIGASGEDSSGTGVTASVDELASASGGLYVFGLEDNDFTWSQRFYVKPITVGAGDAFGAAVAISGDAIAVGAPNESSNALTVNGDAANNTSASSGAAYVIR